jgi:hypothetical protein
MNDVGTPVLNEQKSANKYKHPTVQQSTCPLQIVAGVVHVDIGSVLHMQKGEKLSAITI